MTLLITINFRFIIFDQNKSIEKKIRYYRLIWLKHDLPAGLSVFLVALPLCLGIALASGAPLYAGILSGIIGGLVVSIISGSQLGVSGPAAGLSTIVSASIISFGDFHVFLLAVLVAGLFQVVLGLLKLGVIANYFPSAVIKGMLAAIGIILISKQIPVALGYDQPDFWSSGFLTLFSKHFVVNIENLNLHTTRGAILITIVSLAVLVLLQQNFAKRLRFIPAPVAGCTCSYPDQCTVLNFYRWLFAEKDPVGKYPPEHIWQYCIPCVFKTFYQ